MTTFATRAPDGVCAARTPAGRPGIEVCGLTCRFGDHVALADVSLDVRRGEIHALLGPNGAGKTTMLRILTGLVTTEEGEIRLLDRSAADHGYRGYRRAFGLVPSGDRTFYLRLTGLENLLFFARLHGLRRRRAHARALECLEAVDLRDAADKAVALYSHGMQKRLSVARAILGDPAVLLVDEATHDLDPEGARRVQDIVVRMVEGGTAVLWTTQRLDEIRGFADGVTILDRGTVRFSGTVPELLALATPRRYVLHLGPGGRPVTTARQALEGHAQVTVAAGDDQHLLLELEPEAHLGDALAVLHRLGYTITRCTEERSGLEQAFLGVVGGGR